jgi:hypothetical protein
MRSMSRTVGVIAACAAIAIFSGCAPKYADISGTVFYCKDFALGSTALTPLSGSEVRLMSGLATADTQYSDAAGGYEFASVDPGTYSIRAYYASASHPDAGISSCRIDSGPWQPVSAYYPDLDPTAAYDEYSGLTVAAGDEVMVDFRLAGY